MDINDFDFMAEPKEPDTPLDQREDNPKAGKTPMMDNKKFAQSILDVYETLGGAEWLLGEAKIDPKGYMNMLSKLLPKSIDAADLHGITIMLVDQYLEGDRQVLIQHTSDRSPALPASAAPAAGGGPSELGQPASKFKTATSGNPEIELIDIFK